MKEHPPTEVTGAAAPQVAEAERLIGTTLLAGLVAAILALFAVSWLAEEMLEGETARFDAVVSGAVQSLANPVLTDVMRFASRFGGPSDLLVIGVIVLAVFVYRRWLRGVILLVVALGGFPLPIPVRWLRAFADLSWKGHLQPSPAGWIDLAALSPLMDCSRLQALGWQPRHTAEATFHELGDSQRFTIGPAQVRCTRLNHPWIAIAYRVEVGGLAALLYGTPADEVDQKANAVHARRRVRVSNDEHAA